MAVQGQQQLTNAASSALGNAQNMAVQGQQQLTNAASSALGNAQNMAVKVNNN